MKYIIGLENRLTGATLISYIEGKARAVKVAANLRRQTSRPYPDLYAVTIVAAK